MVDGDFHNLKFIIQKKKRGVSPIIFVEKKH
jgi:hypothetical protein